jgi:hypothetical protein
MHKGYLLKKVAGVGTAATLVLALIMTICAIETAAGQITENVILPSPEHRADLQTSDTDNSWNESAPVIGIILVAISLGVVLAVLFRIERHEKRRSEPAVAVQSQKLSFYGQHTLTRMWGLSALKENYYLTVPATVAIEFEWR